jgi:hypothetical protein
MKKILSLFALIFLFNSCQSLEKGLGFRKDIPDEFLVEKRNPLIMPPNYDLVPPDSVNQNDKKDENDNLKKIINKNTEKNTKENEINKGTDSRSLEKSILEKIK